LQLPPTQCSSEAGETEAKRYDQENAPFETWFGLRRKIHNQGIVRAPRLTIGNATEVKVKGLGITEKRTTHRITGMRPEPGNQDLREERRKTHGKPSFPSKGKVNQWSRKTLGEEFTAGLNWVLKNR
jgi:hypothetical protein